MMNASQIYTNDTLATSRKPAAKTALKIIAPITINDCPPRPLPTRRWHPPVVWQRYRD